ncbi:hypothetical protein AX17_006700 [Amanita inopinata Kibby_2008]|nr:hypothetical protein AX17_006700 [Amanita inopinata Kibby_2008]
MSHASSPGLASSRYSSPALSISAGSSVHNLAIASAKPKAKAVNVFTNDGSFLERFQRSKKEEDEKRKQEEILERKKHFDDRFRKRGKRRHPGATPEPERASPASDASSVTAAADENPAKKLKTEAYPPQSKPTITEYEKHAQSPVGRNIKTPAQV